MAQQPNICKTLQKSVFDTYQESTYSPTDDQHNILHRILVLSCRSDIAGKTVFSHCRNSGPVTHLQDEHQGNTSCQGHRCCSTLERTQRDMYLSNAENFPYPSRNGFSTDWPALPIVTQKQNCYW